MSMLEIFTLSRH